MTNRPGMARVAGLAALTSLLLGAPPSSSAWASSPPACHHPNGPRCSAALRAQRSARRAAHWAQLRTAPILKAEGDTLSWSAVPGIGRYVLVRVLAGKPRLRHVVTGTSAAPRAVPGATVEYLLRTHVAHSHWSAPVTIAYPAAPSRPSRPREGGGSGSGAGSEKLPGPGAGSQGGSGGEKQGGSGGEKQPVSGGGSQGEGGSGTETPSSEGTHAGSGFETGVVPTTLAGSEPTTVKSLGAHSVRMEFPVGAPPSALASAVEAYARAGLRVLPLAGFYGTLPSATEARNLASWAATYGPGGSFWAGKPFPEVPVTAIEFGNETSYTYQFSDNSQSGVTARAQAYALRFKEAQVAIKSVSSVGLLAQADDGGTGSPAWVNGMFSAVPDLASRVAGWTVHPYGPTWQRKIDALIATTAARGAPASIPIYVTELGIAVDNGRCLSDNYGWNPCMSNSEAAATLTGVVGGMRARYGSRLRALYLYQAQDQRPESATNDRENYFGLLQSNGASKGAFTTAVQTVMASGGVASSARPVARVASSRGVRHSVRARSTGHRRAATARLTRRRGAAA